MSEPFYTDPWLTIYGGDCRAVLSELIAESVDCVVTSPPYWGLRDYGTDGQLGLERTPEEYVANIVDVFREVRRVLKPSGTLWLNLGDSYATGGGRVGEAPGGGKQGESWRLRGVMTTPNRMPLPGLKPKDLVGIPWRVAFALQADGWYLRSDIIWAKPNPMPESVTDRPTKAHEYLFLLTKAARYYFDADAVREPLTSGPSDLRKMAQELPRIGGKHKHLDDPMVAASSATNVGRLRSVWTIATRAYPGAHFAVFPPELPERCIRAGAPPAGRRCDCDEIIATPLGEGGAADPTSLIGRAGMNRPRREDDGVRPITRREQRDYARQLTASPHRAEMATAAGAAFEHYTRTDRVGARPIRPTLLAEWHAAGWLTEPAPCAHPEEGPGVVLDPFAGSGTVGMVAQALGRRAILIDLNPAYLKQQLRRAARAWGVGGRELVDDGQAEVPEDSIWAAMAAEAGA